MPEKPEMEAAAAPSRALKAAVLVGLVVQNVSLAVTLRYTRTQRYEYVMSSVVLLQEAVKFAVCCAVLAANGELVATFRDALLGAPSEAARLAVPAAIYTVQTNLLYVAIDHLSTPVYLISAQFKVVTTAVLSVALLGRRLSARQVAALVMLQAGVVLVQYAQHDAAESDAAHASTLVGLGAVALACTTSAFAGVYFERLLKDARRTMWVRNVQLGVFAMPFAAAAMYYNDGARVAANGGVLAGYDALVWFVVLNSAVGGLLVAAVIKYADNIVKCFATSTSIVAASFVAMLFMDFVPATLFFPGAALVVTSVVLYSL
mmetsp:Transcript_57385/g.141049  ORF Transcript_57385/g.141049 Transcript_57385/m.141049 type:complete len:318 (-) Transcript_57385:29-982(-)|eukprot:CAMPEP_0198322552 /NCGR_PEP_ID=MMETSP1450-20131203/11000_1 /TAXON_ID=753684 ORGANISM="Madagascaria erythrocladiodes, Strain CCMP3234" /NCGR_SAMPLE_ID=MMETSP1450 /ASSEMBLY_ACC=CAM_ASM_001115 /LENGTH=317 /DNA_ID=CAMNT_0044026175 /DNA_START=25 /DNA_END=978 /DNA_ORIENTATION=-